MVLRFFLLNFLVVIFLYYVKVILVALHQLCIFYFTKFTMKLFTIKCHPRLKKDYQAYE